MGRESSANRMNNRPRVHLTYDVDTNNATEKRDLPFVMGVVGAYRGASDPKKPLFDRKFTQIDKESFNDVMKSIRPSVRIRVPNPVNPEEELPIELVFEKIEDFNPDRIAEMVPHLKALLDIRRDLDSWTATLTPEQEELVSKVLKGTTGGDS